MLVMCICMDLTSETRAMSKLLVGFSLFWSLVLFLAPVPTLGDFDSGNCTVDDSPGKTQCVHASALVASNPGFCLAALVFSLESCVRDKVRCQRSPSECMFPRIE